MRMKHLWMLGISLAGVLAVPLALALQFDDGGRPPPAREWPLVGGHWGNTRYSTLVQINARTIGHLGGAWISKRFDDGASSRATPVVKDGLMFTTAGSRVYALNARTGQVVWSYRAESRQTPSNVAELLRSGLGVPDREGVATGSGLVFVGLSDAHVIALRQQTGELAWSQYVGDDPPHRGQAISGAPLYARGIVFVGLAADFGPRGRIAALDAGTGREAWHFFTVPGPGEPGHETWPQNSDVWKLGGGAVWLTGSVDPALGLVYFGTGNPVPQFGGELRPGNNLYTVSIVALDIKTGRLRWHYQLVHHDIWEADVSVSPMLYDTDIGGRQRKALAAMRADGVLFLLDRETGRPLIPVDERPVRQETRAKTAATQPYPKGAGQVLPDCTDWKQRVPATVAAFELGCYFSPTSIDPPNLLAPSFFGMRVVPMAYSPQTNYVYATGTAALEWLRRTDDPYFMGLSNNRRVPGLKSYGVLAAIDGSTDALVWKKEFPSGRGTGVTLTAGGLLFYSAPDGNLQAYDARTGEQLWQFQTGFAGAGGPAASYEIDGDQYIAASAGPAVWAFKLGGHLSPAEPPPLPSSDDAFTGPIEDTTQIETAVLAHDVGDTGNRYFTDEYAFGPFRARVKVGARVTWLNNGKLVHTVTAQDGSWTTGPLEPAQAGSRVFDKPGRYTYICRSHPWAMAELIVVESPASVSVSEGVGGDAQATRGKGQYERSCTSCHKDDLVGNDMAPPLVGDPFLVRWRNRSLDELLERVRTSMPPGQPNSLSGDAYLDIVSFLLKANGFRTSQELRNDPASLKETLLNIKED